MSRRSKKEKAESEEWYGQLHRAKTMRKKQKKNLELPQGHKTNKN